MDVEMTAYMVLSLLHISGKEYLEEAARAVRWITTQRNSHGGFVSTQVRDSSGWSDQVRQLGVRSGQTARGQVRDSSGSGQVRQLGVRSGTARGQVRSDSSRSGQGQLGVRSGSSRGQVRQLGVRSQTAWTLSLYLRHPSVDSLILTEPLSLGYSSVTDSVTVPQIPLC